MVNESNLATSIGFRHVIEDGLSVLSNGDLDPGRREYVLEDLTSLLQEATKGSDLVSRSSLFIQNDERNAFEAFSLLDRYLGHAYDQSWRDNLRIAKTAFDQLKRNADLSPDARDAAVSLLKGLLSRIERQGSVGIPEQPEEIKITE